MPVNHKWPIAKLLAAAEEHAQAVKMPVMLEYVLLKGINDQPDHAKELKELVQERPFQVNLIPFNSFF